MIRLTLRWADVPGLSAWAPCKHKGSYRGLEGEPERQQHKDIAAPKMEGAGSQGESVASRRILFSQGGIIFFSHQFATPEDSTSSPLGRRLHS